MKYLVITEKASAAKKIASALAKPGSLVYRKPGKDAPYYEISTFDTGELAFVAAAAGHLHGLEPLNSPTGTNPNQAGAGGGQTHGKKGNKWVFNFTWKPVKRKGGSVHKYIRTFKNIVSTKNIDGFIIATDFDTEGSVIGYNVLRYACHLSRAKITQAANRMKFSTLEASDLRASWKNRMQSPDCSRVEAGYARHWIDILFGINLSRALMHAWKASGNGFRVFSIGRVQGPTLKAVCDRQAAIDAHVPQTYWTVDASCHPAARGDEKIKTGTNGGAKAPARVAGATFRMAHDPARFKDEGTARNVRARCEGRTGQVTRVDCRARSKSPPPPFNLAGLQQAAGKALKFKPSRTLKLAEELYLETLITYPRTSSEIIPPSVDTRSIVSKIANQPAYKQHATVLLGTKLVPHNGKKTDDAHPPIMPTGVSPAGKKISKDALRLYDLIVRRFLATFSTNFTWEERRHEVQVGMDVFRYTRKSITHPGWTSIETTFDATKFQDNNPALQVGDHVTISKVNINEEKTKPPPHFTDLTLLAYMEANNLGTKSTRASIIDKLKDRGYVENHGAALHVTPLGKAVVDVFSKHASGIVDTAMTRKLEIDMEKVLKGALSWIDLRVEAEKMLVPWLKVLESQENSIGKTLRDKLLDGTRATGHGARRGATVLGTCPACKQRQLVVARVNKKRFVACQGYFKGECKTTFPVTQKGRLLPAKKFCPKCGSPMAKIVMKGKKPWIFCVNWAKCDDPATKG